MAWTCVNTGTGVWADDDAVTCDRCDKAGTCANRVQVPNQDQPAQAPVTTTTAPAAPEPAGL